MKQVFVFSLNDADAATDRKLAAVQRRMEGDVQIVTFYISVINSPLINLLFEVQLPWIFLIIEHCTE